MPQPAELRRLVAAIARELDALYGGSRGVDWPGVERHLARMVQSARRDLLHAKPDLRITGGPRMRPRAGPAQPGRTSQPGVQP